MDKLQAMNTFVRVVEAGSFSAVAHESGATQSAVSKQVAALERALGAKLLTRTTRSLALTEEGERYFEQARRLVAEVAEAEATLRRGEQHLSGWLRVAAPVAFFPFSGWKDSFLGDLHAHGPDAVDFYTRKKTVTSRYYSEQTSGRYFVES